MKSSGLELECLAILVYLAPQMWHFQLEVQRVKGSQRINQIGIKKGLTIKGSMNSFTAVNYNTTRLSLYPNT